MVSVLLPAAPTAALEPVGNIGDVVVERVGGLDRIGTAVAISQATFAHADQAVLVGAGAVIDGLVAAPLASSVGGPVLLTGRDGLAESVTAELGRLGVSRVVVLGGEHAVSARVEEQLRGWLSVERVAGADRFATAALVAGRLPTSCTSGRGCRYRRAYIVRGDDVDGRGIADALSVVEDAAALGNAILLSSADEVGQATAAVIAQLAQRNATLVLVGGEHVLSRRLEETLDDGTSSAVLRIAGADRYATSALLFDRAIDRCCASSEGHDRWLVDGRSLVDALAVGPAVAAAGGVLLLVDGADLARSAESVDRLRAHRRALERVVLVGGTSSISSSATAQLEAILLNDDLDAPRCASEQLAARFRVEDGALGTVGGAVQIVNVSDQVCTLLGRAGLQLLDEQGEPVPTELRYAEQEPYVIPLAPHGALEDRSPSDFARAGQAHIRLSYRGQQEPTCGPDGTERVIEGVGAEVILPHGPRIRFLDPDRERHVLSCQGRMLITPLVDSRE